MNLGITKWKNPTDKTARVSVFVSPGQHAEYVIAPNGEGDIPSQFDNAIHQIRDGVIVGGLAPQLVREGQTAKVHPALLPPKDEKPKATANAKSEKQE